MPFMQFEPTYKVDNEFAIILCRNFQAGDQCGITASPKEVAGAMQAPDAVHPDFPLFGRYPGVGCWVDARIQVDFHWDPTQDDLMKAIEAAGSKAPWGWPEFEESLTWDWKQRVLSRVMDSDRRKPGDVCVASWPWQPRLKTVTTALRPGYWAVCAGKEMFNWQAHSILLEKGDSLKVERPADASACYLISFGKQIELSTGAIMEDAIPVKLVSDVVSCTALDKTVLNIRWR